MLKTIRAAVIGIIAMALSSFASAAEGFDTNKLFFGAGLSSNDVSGSDSAAGWQVFGGYGFGEVATKLYIDAEVGYMDSGKMTKGLGTVSYDGLWATGVVRYLVVPSVELIGRLGVDFGDDNGLMAGIGAGLILTKNFKIRLEFVQRDNLNSVQLNLVFQP